ncbi:hypothetical protein DVJ83_18155 (plasmid) [Deinococcus wulumuqiensis]|uniref:Uncharacterized protein n=1 Tax=Deinococcus wulumuqiensis TaxID=980427 RepID=A0A345IMU5_9DEIO|nr:hypothetical protein DVJ83_18155 [Deinococcus wulumuqiensis]
MHPYRGIRIFSYSFQSVESRNLLDSIGIRIIPEKLISGITDFGVSGDLLTHPIIASYTE